MKKIHNRYKILSNQKVCERFIQISLDAPQLAKSGKPGQFLNVRISDELDPFFRRPFGIYHVHNGIVDMLVEIRGKGTAMLAERKPGEMLDILGPLGKSFSMPGKKIKNVVMIGGGIGVAPLLSMAEALKDSGKKMILLYGGRDSSYVFDLKFFKEAGCKVHIATDDGSVGMKGRISELFDKIPLSADDTMLCVCGPSPMMKSVQGFAKKHGLKGECSCEEVMACGIGACMGCVVKTTSGYKTACHDGPVFDLQEVIFE
jgi:dihydroorotate dehydrogenase electron transfer subunit